MSQFLNISTDFSDCPRFVKGLSNRDASLWSHDPGVQRGIGERLGWLDAAAFMDRNNGRIVDFARRVRSEGYQHAVLLGMGGSSLAPEVYTALFGGGPDDLVLTVVDSTSPAHVKAVTEQCARAPTLFIVSSKSGTTVETRALDAHFYEWARARDDRAQDRFVAITDPGSPLERLATERGYRETFLNPADIGGRFSALSCFGLVPAALAGADLDTLRAHLPDMHDDAGMLLDGCRLGTALAALARAGRNKLTLQLSPSLAPLAPWIEQLIDESTGKDGTGVVVIPDEPRLEPDAYGADRVFAVVDLEREPVEDSWVEALTRRGHPVARWRIAGLERLGAELFRWQVATAAAGRVLGINPFDEPDVNATKDATRRLLERGADDVEAPGRVMRLDEALDNAMTGDYLAVLAYLPPTPETRRRLAGWGTELTRRTGLPACVSFGPRYLHSSGQLHKGGPNQGIFIVVTARSGDDVPVPGQSHGFRSLFRAQALGDVQVLIDRDRRVVHLELDDPDAGLDAVIRSTS